MKKLILIFCFTISLFHISLVAQDTYQKCPCTGDGKTETIRHQDSLKNRFEIPQKYKSVELSELLNAKDGSLDDYGAVEITGYIVVVKDGGVESCNCHSKKYKDTHIYIAASADEKDKSNCLIVEVTPRIRSIIKDDWTTKGLTKTFLGRKVTIDGYLFDDSEHKPNSKADNPKAKHLWRSSCYEVHPVTDIEIK